MYWLVWMLVCCFVSPVGEPYAPEFVGYEEQDQQQQQQLQQQQQFEEGKYSMDNPCYPNTPLYMFNLQHMHVS